MMTVPRRPTWLTMRHPQLDNSVPYALSEIPNGKAGTVKTLTIMADLVRVYKANASIRQLAVQLLGSVNGNAKNYKAQIQRLFNFVQTRIGYVRDIRGVETIQTPLYTLDIGSGDCDDKSVLLATLIECIGHPTRFLAMGFAPENYCHVICEVYINGCWVSLDPTENRPMGWKPPDIVCGYCVECKL